MSAQYVINVQSVEKSFKVYLDKGTTLKEKVLFKKRARYESRQILRGINFQIPSGQAVGLIGKNGCGKSTILKLLSRIYKPNRGEISVEGRVSSLIELGAGFHPDMSGKENIYINASIFGLTREEIDAKMDDIIRFSELEEFINNPVRTYSSGMYMRLAFAVAINVNADVLLIDEILAVGDVSFQKKCFDRLLEIKDGGTTIVIVSHDMDQLYKICDRFIWIEDGQVKEDGEPRLIGNHYLDSMEEARLERLAQESREKFSEMGQEGNPDGDASGGGHTILELTEFVHPEARRFGTQEVYYTKVELLNKDGEPCQIFSTGDEVVLRCGYAAREAGVRVNFNMDFVRDNWQYCYGSCFAKAGEPLPELEGEGWVKFHIQELMLLPGKYYLDIGINGVNGELYDNVRNILQITVREYAHNEFGPCTFTHDWTLE